MMHLCCLDLEGVLIPEIWIEVACKTKLDKLKLTTRDIPNYDRLMKYRLKILKQEGIRLKDIQSVIQTMSPLPGAKSFLKKLQSHYPVIILSDTFYEFAAPLMKKLDHPTLLCNWLKVDQSGSITGYQLRQKDGKRKAVKAFKQIGFKITASGDSYNDLTMLREAHRGILFRPPSKIAKSNRKFKVAKTYSALLSHFLK